MKPYHGAGCCLASGHDAAGVEREVDMGVLVAFLTIQGHVVFGLARVVEDEALRGAAEDQYGQEDRDCN